MYCGWSGDVCGIYTAEGVGVAEVAVAGVEAGWRAGDLKERMIGTTAWECGGCDVSTDSSDRLRQSLHHIRDKGSILISRWQIPC